MLLYVKRETAIGEATPGMMYIDGEFFCYTLEDMVREHKIWGRTAISAGAYLIMLALMTNSKNEQRVLPKLMNVPNFTGIFIHKLNRIDQTNGCIGIGFKRDRDIIWESEKAEIALMEKLTDASKRQILAVNIEDA